MRSIIFYGLQKIVVIQGLQEHGVPWICFLGEDSHLNSEELCGEVKATQGIDYGQRVPLSLPECSLEHHLYMCISSFLCFFRFCHGVALVQALLS